jgi:hypothetical protein
MITIHLRRALGRENWILLQEIAAQEDRDAYSQALHYIRDGLRADLPTIAQANKMTMPRLDEVAKIKTAISEAIPANVEIASIVLALADMTREFTTMLVRILEEDEDGSAVREEDQWTG